jgi:cytochrome c556
MNDTSWQRRRARRLTPLWLTLALTALPAAASEGEAEYREHVMESIGGHMQATADILRQKVTHEDHVRLHVNALADMAGIAHTLFPAGSEGGDALPGIWENPEDFAAKLDALEEAAAELRTTVNDGGDIGPAFQKVGQACKSCHDDYRDE